MQNHKKQDSLFVNIITPPNDVKTITKTSVGNAGKDPFCIYDHKRHAAGSVINHSDGSESTCSTDSSWVNS